MAVVEFTVFHLREGADDGAFLEADKRLQREVLPHHAGFLRRTVARADNGDYAVLTLWEGTDDATASATRCASDPLAGAVEAFVDPDTRRSRRFETLD
jgi:hypothetical protein